ncbi:MAG TPA: hypothetical protein VGF48_08705 [Thermoanaerobaculia bacterium]
MKRLLAVLALLAVALPVFAQQQFQTLQKGFQPEKLYHYDSIDSVNVFNGNLVVVLPIGAGYSLNGGLSYQLTLSFNSKAWDLLAEEGGKVHAMPARRSNAGIGWILGMGRYVAAGEPSNETGSDVYEAPDGGDHLFNAIIHGRCADGSCPSTSDGSNLRRRTVVAGSVIEIDFPDGSVRRFEKSGSEWKLTRISGPLSTDAVTITYGTVATTACPEANSTWTISDSRGRTHSVCFKDRKVDGVARPMVDRVVLLSPAASEAVYQFHYVQATNLQAPPEDNDHDLEGWSRIHSGPQLVKIDLPSTGTDDAPTFQFGYGHSGVEITSLTLPTLGRISYQYETFHIPPLNYCGGISNDVSYIFGGQTTGVFRRTFTPAVPAGQTATASQWEYQTSLVRRGTGSQGYTSEDCAAGTGGSPVWAQLYDEFLVTIVDPAGNKTVNHFSVWPGNLRDGQSHADPSPGGALHLHYGLPYGEKKGDLYLSQESFEKGTGGALTLKRTNWVRHDVDDIGVTPPTEPQAPHRLAAQKTEYTDDTGCGGVCWTSSESTDWDGYGHYRVVTTKGNFNGSTLAPEWRKSTTSWNKENGVARTILPGHKWILNTFEDVTTTDGSKTIVQQSCFDLNTGFLKAYRQLAGQTPWSSDLVAIYDKDTSGHFVSEKHYGGDRMYLPNAANTQYLCSALSALATATARFSLTHTWQHGRPAKSKHANTTFFDADTTVDLYGVVTSARDSAEVETSYTYDVNGRVKTITPAGGASVSYAYKSATADTNGALLTPARVIETTTSLAAGTIQREYQFDSFGRFWREKKQVPSIDGSALIWNLRETKFDGLGRAASTSETVELPSAANELTFSPAALTSLTYDAFGRKTSVTAPDGSIGTWSYQGVRKNTRTTSGGGHRTTPLQIQVTETYDSFGRMAAVSEQSGASGAAVKTTYTYGLGGQLSGVHMAGSASEGVQNRLFDYDGRGLLVWESHPESGLTAYEYDARGLVYTRDRGAAQTEFDQKFDYDDAERLITVYSRDPANPAGYRLLKEFDYAIQNEAAANGEPIDYVNGKLRSAKRYNYPLFEPLLYPELKEQEIRVTEIYAYRDAGGRPSARWTKIENVADGAPQTYKLTYHKVAYNDLGLPASVTYPSCTQCGTPPGFWRTISTVYDKGVLKGLNDFVPKITYWPNGMRYQLEHKNGIVDTQTVDPSGMARPASLSAGLYNSCTAPKIVQATTGGTVSGSAVTLSVTVTGTAPLSYQWYIADTGAPIPSATGSTYDAMPPQTTEYYVEVANACNTVVSRTMRVAVGNCVEPWITSATASRNTNGSYTLTAAAHGTATLTYTWRRLPDNALVGTGVTVQTPVLTAPTEYVLTVTNSCGGTGDSEQVYAGEKPPLAAPAFIEAKMTPPVGNNPLTVSVSWGSSDGASSYKLERLDASSDAEWVQVAEQIGTSYTDNNVTPNAAYAYRVRASRGNPDYSPYSLADLATTVAFSPVIVGVTRPSISHFAELLTAVNAIRATAGWAAVSWSNILSPADPLPAPATSILAKHIVALRARMNEAIHAVGVPVSGYSDSDPHLKSIKASQLLELQTRAN